MPHCKPIPVMKTGFSLCSISNREKPVFITGIPANKNRIFPVWKYYTGKTLFWPCTGPVRECSAGKIHLNTQCPSPQFLALTGTKNFLSIHLCPTPLPRFSYLPPSMHKFGPFFLHLFIFIFLRDQKKGVGSLSRYYPPSVFLPSYVPLRPICCKILNLCFPLTTRSQFSSVSAGEKKRFDIH